MIPRIHTLREGLVIGLIAYLSVAAFYAMFDLFAARGLLYTVNLLGLTAFRGLRDLAVIQFPIARDPVVIFLYNGFHLGLSLAIGLTVVGLVAHAEYHPTQGRVVLGVIAAGFALTILAVGLLTRSIRPLLPWWSIVGANVVSVLLAGTYLVRRHRGIWRRLAFNG